MKRLVAVSGGKDSTAMALRLRELFPETEFVFFATPTGDELPELFTHLDKLEGKLGQRIVRVYHPDFPDLYTLIKHFEALPNFRQRWCTRILKIEAAQHFYQQFDSAEVYVALRADEQSRQGNTGKALGDVPQRFPLREWGWGLDEVWNYLNKRSVSIPARTDCGCCFFQRIGEWWKLWRYYPQRYAYYMQLEASIGHTFMAPGKHVIWPHALGKLAREFQKGRKPREIIRGENEGCRVCSL